MPLLTIITVVYNDSEGLKKTIQSIEEQSDLNDVEYIVIDGDSKDATLDVIKKSSVIDKYISEQDKGIYDAMNKGVNIALGEWFIFLNAGDAFNSLDVISDIKKEIQSMPENVNLIYGDYISGGVFYRQNLNIDFLTSHMINHQNIFYKRTLFTEKRYSIKYRFCADYKHLLDNFSSIEARKVNFIISEFDDTGISSQLNNKYKMWLERLRAIWETDLPFITKCLLSRRGIIALPYQFIRAAFLK